MGLPVGVALFGIGIGTAIVTLLSNVLTDPRLRHVPRHHDRPRRRHRLRPAHRHPLPRAAPRGPRRARVRRDRHRHRRPVRAVRRHHRRHLAARHAARWASPSCQGLAVGAAVGRRRHGRRLAHPAARPCSASPASASSAPAGGASSPPASSPSALVGIGLEHRAADRSGSPLAVDRARRRVLRSGPSSGEVPRRAPKPLPRDHRLPLEPHHPAPAVAGRHRRHGWSCSCSPSRCWACGSASPTRATSRRTPRTKQAYDLLVDGFGAGLQRPAAARRRAARGHRHRRPRPPSARRSPPIPASPSCRPPAQRPRRTRPRCSGRSSPPPARRTRPRPSSSTGCATTSCRRSRTAAGVEVDVTGTVAVNIDFSRLPGRHGCRTSSPPCWRCRSCC